MIGLVNRFKNKQIAIHDFLGQSKVLLGERLYQILVLKSFIIFILM